jgi:hypothetical protein
MRDAETIALVRMMRKEGKSYRKISRELAAENRPAWSTPILAESPWNDHYAHLDGVAA